MNINATLQERVRAALLAEVQDGHWIGELSSSALATAVAIVALFRNGDLADQATITEGLGWLVATQLDDGSWGDTTSSLGNISTTVLAWAACGYAGRGNAEIRASEVKAAAWITVRAGGLKPAQLVRAIEARYGKDRTFAVPILTLCAIAGRLGADPWRWVRPLPFEFAAFPRSWFRFLDLQVVSYALPALIAVGQARFARRKPRNPVTWLFRHLTKQRTLRRLQRIQPTSGGYLEAVPLTGFVAMSLLESGQRDHAVTKKCLSFLRASRRADGSWPIDENLATWLTTLSVNALSAGPAGVAALSDELRQRVLTWLLNQQGKTVHPYTGAAAGAWAWTDLPGGVPDADDTAGALIALHHLGADNPTVVAAAEAGLQWLVQVQNRDGGIPTFCRGWGALEFDRSAPDLTAHALAAFLVWKPHLRGRLALYVERARQRALTYLHRSQRSDGSWVPLWFGNQNVNGDVNPTYATARVVASMAAIIPDSATVQRGVRWLCGTQRADGSWGGSGGSPGSIEETGLALDALLRLHAKGLTAVIARGMAALERMTAEGTTFTPAPIGFYFAKLWYFERLYPLIFAAGALERGIGRGVEEHALALAAAE